LGVFDRASLRHITLFGKADKERFTRTAADVGAGVFKRCDCISASPLCGRTVPYLESGRFSAMVSREVVIFKASILSEVNIKIQ
jgi:hypothetical protein